MQAQIFIRSQKSRWSSSSRFGGPDKYIAVVIREDGQEPWPINRPLNTAHLAKAGYRFVYCGEGYSANQGPRSSFGKAYAKAEEVARQAESTN